MKVDKRVLVVGGGGHAVVSIEVLRAAGNAIAGCLTRDGIGRDDLEAIGASVLGTDSDLAAFVARGLHRIFVAVGENRDRLALATAVVEAGGALVRALSPAAVVSPSAEIGDGALVMPGAIINARATLGISAVVNTRASVDHGCHIGQVAHLAPGTSLAGDVEVGEGALVGIGACVAPRRRIGPWATVGAGAAVVSDVAAGATVVGVPARQIRP